jgi:hypothetical protein
MHPRRGILVFVAASTILTVVLGWVFWSATAQVGMYSLRRSMVVVPVLSVMLGARGFAWRRKAVYSAIVFGVYVLGGIVADAIGLHAVDSLFGTRGLFVALAAFLYLAFLWTFPLATLVLFVGRTPAMLWSRRSD